MFEVYDFRLRWLLIPLGLLSLYPLYCAGLLGWLLLSEVLTPRPRPAEIDTVERALAPIACVGPLDQWDRTYFYAISRARQGTPISPAPRDQGRVEFRYYLALGGPFESRRRVSTSEAVSNTFHHFNFKMRGVNGAYDLSSGTLQYECWESSGDDY